MRIVRVQICTALFLVLTLVKLVSPAAAVQIRRELQPVLNRNDDYSRLLHRLEGKLDSEREMPLAEYDPRPPLTELRHTLERFSDDPMAKLPKREHFSAPEVVPTPEPDPALSYGYAAREAFLSAQSSITDVPPPDNVSYEVLSLPFQESSPISGETSSGFGYRLHPIQNEVLFHYGTDFAADAGTEIHSFADGVVLASGTDSGYGNYVKVDHGGGFVTLYGHCSERLVSEGERVQRGQTIALVGSTGQSTGPHLHFELIHDGVYLNPEFYLYA